MREPFAEKGWVFTEMKTGLLVSENVHTAWSDDQPGQKPQCEVIAEISDPQTHHQLRTLVLEVKLPMWIIVLLLSLLMAFTTYAQGPGRRTAKKAVTVKVPVELA